jgi:hypothetical protein
VDEKGRACSTHGEDAGILDFGGKDRRKETTRKNYRHRWEDNIRMDLREMGWGGMDWVQLAQDRDQWRALVNTVMKLRVP